MRTPALDLPKIRHDLRTPINHILGYCEMLLEEEAMPEKLLADLRKIHASGKQLLDLIARYLDEETFGSQQNLQQVQHELRTPVNHIVGYSELLIEQAGEPSQQRFLADLEKIRSAAKSWLGIMESHLLPPPAGPASTEAAKRATASMRRRSAKKVGRAKPAGSGRPLQDLTPAKLLVVDDDEASRELLARRLHHVGFSVVTARDGSTALELERNTAFDLVLLDCVMPGLHGFQVLTRLRKAKSMSELPVIMVTGRDSSVDVVRALKLGANDYLTKPVDFSIALARITTHLQLRRAQEEIRRQMEEIRRLATDLQVRNEFIKGVFGRYVTSDVVESLLETPQGLKLGGQKRVVTILMSDLRDFTTLSEKLAPEKVVEMLNIYLGSMAEVISHYNGVIDEFIGDAILAVFGAPIMRGDHAESAVACALAMQAGMDRVNRRLARVGIQPLAMGIAINTGEVVVGNIGSDRRAKYGVVGAQVNLTGRIQSATLGREVLVSESTAAALGPRLKVERTMTISPKGVTHPVKLFSVKGLSGYDHLNIPAPASPGPDRSDTFKVECYQLDEDKSTCGRPFTAELICSSPREGFLKTSRCLRERSDLKVEILPTKPKGKGLIAYCKIVDSATGGRGYSVQFSSPLPEVRGASKASESSK